MKPKHLLCILLIFSTLLPVYSQVSLFELLSPDSITKVRIETDMKQLVRKKMDMEYQDGRFEFLSGPLKGKDFDIEVRARGNIRKEVCYYPPIKLKFPKSEIEFHKIKWVNICDGTNSKQDLLLKEYLIYKLYQTLTDISFDVRLFEVDFIEPDEDESKLKSYAFMIEPLDHLESRTSTEEYEPRLMRAFILDRYYYPLMEVFQYLVANTDWHVANAHNMKFLKSFERKTVVPVPYDFDYSGFVNAGYAIPRETLPIKHVRERYNKGHCMTMEELEEVMKTLLEKKESMFAVINEFELMDERDRQALVKYLERGFEDLEKKNVRKRLFTRECETLEN